MAKDKKGFILYADLLKVCEKLILKDRANKTNYTGELFYAILLYVNDLEELIDVEFIVELAFEPIKLQLKRDLKKFEEVKKKRSEAGKRSAEIRAEQKLTEPTLVESAEQTSTNSTVSDSVNDNDKDKDNVIYINAYDFLKANSSSEIEAFEMQNKNSFNNYKNFIDYFNNKVNFEGIEFTSKKLMARLRMLNSNWDKKPKPKHKKPTDQITL